MHKLAIVSFLAVYSCTAKQNNSTDDQPVPVIESFTVLPLSVNEGDSVTLSIAGTGFDSCSVLANGEEINDLRLTGSESKTHIPSSDTEYSVFCESEGGQASASVSINLIIADDVLSSDSLVEIGKVFDVRDLEDAAGKGLSDFNPEIDQATLPRKNVELIAVGDSSMTASFDLESSLVYGLSNNISETELNAQCLENLDVTEDLVGLAEFSMELEASEEMMSYLVPNLYHVIGFEAVTQSLDSPILVGTEWEVGFGTSQTEVAYSQDFKDFGTANGLFTVGGGATPLPDIFIPLAAIFPDGYPVPPPANGYTYDPTHPTCSDRSPDIDVFTTYQNAAEYCAAVSDIRCEPGGRLPRFPLTVKTQVPGLPISTYINPAPSNRISTGNILLNCADIAPTLADQYNLQTGWTQQTFGNEVLFFNTNRTCSGPNCTGLEPRLSDRDPAKWNLIEPGSNMCISRWKNQPFEAYRQRLENLCRQSPVFIKAVADADRNNAATAMANQCNGNNACQDAAISLGNLFDNDLNLSEIDQKISEVMEATARAKEARISYLIPANDMIFSRLADLEKISSDLNAGKSEIIKARFDNDADWNLGMELLIGRVMPAGFQSPEEFTASVGQLERAVGLLKVLASADIVRLSCSWSAAGRFRSFDGIRVNEVKNVATGDEFNLTLKNVAPLDQ